MVGAEESEGEGYPNLASRSMYEFRLFGFGLFVSSPIGISFHLGAMPAEKANKYEDGRRGSLEIEEKAICKKETNIRRNLTEWK